MKQKSNPTSPRGRQAGASILPNQFAENVLDCETDLDIECKLETVLKLMELYSVFPI